MTLIVLIIELNFKYYSTVNYSLAPICHYSPAQVVGLISCLARRLRLVRLFHFFMVYSSKDEWLLKEFVTIIIKKKKRRHFSNVWTP